MRPTKLTKRPVAESDADFLFTLYASSRADEVAAFGWDARTVESFLRMQHAARERHYSLQYPDANDDVIVLDDIPIGRVRVARTMDEIMIVDIALLPEHRNEGLGTGLLTALCDEADGSCLPLRLHVAVTNRAASLYARLGFQPMGSTDGVYLEMERSPRSTQLS